MLKFGPTLGWFANILFQNKNRAETLEIWRVRPSELDRISHQSWDFEYLFTLVIHIYRRSIFSFDRYFFNFKGLQSQQNCHQPRQPSPITSRGRVPILLRAGRSNRGQQFHPFLHLYLLFIGLMCTLGPIIGSPSIYVRPSTFLKSCEDLVKTVNVVNAVKT